jgi:hypothetical protein
MRLLAWLGLACAGFSDIIIGGLWFVGVGNIF